MSHFTFWVRTVRDRWRGKPVKFRELTLRYQRNWERVKACWLIALTHLEHTEPLLARQATMFDIYHSLAAARWSLYLAFLAYATYDLAAHRELMVSGREWHYIYAIPINILLGLLWNKVLTTVRRRTLRQAIQFMQACFVYAHIAEEERKKKDLLRYTPW